MRRIRWLVAGCVLLWAGIASAEIREVIIGVDGLSCPFCVLNIEKKLKEIDALENLQISYKHGLVKARVKEGHRLDSALVKRKVTDSGFTLRDLTLTIIGTVERWQQEHLAVRARGTDELFLLDTNDPSALERYAQTKTLVAVTGKAHNHADLPPALSVERVSPTQ